LPLRLARIFTFALVDVVKDIGPAIDLCDDLPFDFTGTIERVTIEPK
jgi:hypothetical protein